MTHLRHPDWLACAQAALIGTRRQMAVSVRTCGICAGNTTSIGFAWLRVSVVKSASCRTMSHDFPHHTSLADTAAQYAA